MTTMTFQRGLLAGLVLSMTVWVAGDRRHRVVLPVGALAAPVEHVVRREVNQRNAGLRAGARNGPRPVSVHSMGLVGRSLGGIDGGVGRGVDREHRLVHLDGAGNGSAIGNVGLGPAETNNRMACDGSKPAERRCDLAGFAEDKNAIHGWVRLLRPRRLTRFGEWS